jgi:hypothetical protein
LTALCAARRTPQRTLHRVLRFLDLGRARAPAGRHFFFSAQGVFHKDSPASGASPRRAMLTLQAESVVRQLLFGPDAAFAARVAQVFDPLERKGGDGASAGGGGVFVGAGASGLRGAAGVAGASARPVFHALTQGQRWELVQRLRKMKQHLARKDLPDAERERALKEYRSIKKRVRNCSAAQIQAVWRGYRVRKPVSLALRDHAHDRVSRTLERIKEARVAAGRPENLEDMDLADLAEEKRSVSLLLVGFERQFRKKHGRLPTKKENERLRPLYHVYQRIKALLEAAQERARARDQAAAQAQLLARLKAEKKRLQQKLNRFEQAFRAKNGREIKWESDISEVKDEYVRYKQLKADILRLSGGAAVQQQQQQQQQQPPQQQQPQQRVSPPKASAAAEAASAPAPAPASPESPQSTAARPAASAPSPSRGSAPSAPRQL